jgi:hypothetical protein
LAPSFFPETAEEAVLVATKPLLKQRVDLFPLRDHPFDLGLAVNLLHAFF